MEYMFGATLGTMALLPSLGLRGSPDSGYQPFSTVVRLGDGRSQGNGFPIVTWHWAFVTVAERAVFANALSGDLSTPVYIRTRLPDNTWATFSCILHWPTGEEDLQAGSILDFTLEFTHCVVIPDS